MRAGPKPPVAAGPLWRPPAAAVDEAAADDGGRAVQALARLAASRAPAAGRADAEHDDDGIQAAVDADFADLADE